jgi:glycosyltransferase involved in cell wall biosynthesis
MTGAIRVSCIVPAYNEAPRIGRVLEVALATPGIDEVIVIDDASSDGTAEIAEALARQHPALRVLRQAQNGGKTRAVARGVAEASGSHLLMLDSDLIGLTPDSLMALIAPVAEGRSDVSISLRGNAPRIWRAIGLDYISGERVLPRAILADRLDALDQLPRFGLEVFMNRVWIETGLAIAVVRWPGVSSPLKSAKQGLRAGIVADAKMIRDILRTVSLGEILRQIRAMRRQRI